MPKRTVIVDTDVFTTGDVPTFDPGTGTFVPGPGGASGGTFVGDKNWVHDQTTPSTEWIIPHNLGKYPALTFVDTAGTEIDGEVIHDSINLARGLFLAPFMGKAFAN